METKPISEQDLIDSASFPEDGVVAYGAKSDPHPDHQSLHWSGVSDEAKAHVLRIQKRVWRDALAWERTSPFSASNKRIAALERVISE